MKLIFFIDSRRKIGGGSYAQFVFAKNLALRGHEVVIFAADKNFYSTQLKVETLKVYYRHTIPLFYKRIGIDKINDIWAYLYAIFVIKPFIKKFKPDWIIGYLRPSAIKAEKLGKQLNIKVANFVYENPVWMQQVLSEELNDIPLKSLLKSWKKTKHAYENSKILIPNSKLSGIKMKEWIPNAPISNPVYPGIEKIEIKSYSRDIDIIYIGRLHFLKNINELLLACKPGYSIVIIGKGEEEEKLKKLAKKMSLNIRFLGAVSDEDKWEYLQKSKLLISPSSFEGFGMPPLEALACGCQVLCSDIPIFHEIYSSDVMYFNLHDIADLKEKIELILKNKTDTVSKLPDKYTWINAAIKIESILQLDSPKILSSEK